MAGKKIGALWRNKMKVTLTKEELLFLVKYAERSIRLKLWDSYWNDTPSFNLNVTPMEHHWMKSLLAREL